MVTVGPYRPYRPYSIARMNTHVLSNLRDLVGVWTCLVFLVGLGAMAVCHFSRIPGDSKPSSGMPARISATLATGMFLLALFIVLFVVPASIAYSGPVPPEDRRLWLYDKYLAALIALVFAAALGLSSFRIRRAAR